MHLDSTAKSSSAERFISPIAGQPDLRVGGLQRGLIPFPPVTLPLTPPDLNSLKIQFSTSHAMKSLRILLGTAFLTLSAVAQSLSLSTSQTEIAVAPGFNHTPLRLGFTYTGPDASDLSRLTVSSDSSWLAGTVDTASRAIVVSFTTATLVNRTYTATLTVTDGTVTAQAFVRATIAPLNITTLLDDPVRSRAYGLQQDGANQGGIVVFDPLTLKPVANLTTGKRPVDFAISSDGNEMLVLHNVDKTLVAVDLRTLAIRETIALPAYDEWSGPVDTSGHVRYGAGNIIYYVDGSWGPVLRVLNRVTRTVLQSTFFDGTAYTGAGNVTHGFGDLVVTPDKAAIFSWSQFGWSAGSSSTSVSKFTIKADGTVARASTGPTSSYSTGLNRDPLNTPALVTADGKTVFLKQLAFDTAAPGTPVRTFPSPVFAISPGGEIVVTQSAIFDYATGNRLYDLPVFPASSSYNSTAVQVVTSDYARLVYFDPVARVLKSVNLFEQIGVAALRRESSPAHQAIVLPPTKLQWTPLAGVDRYRVYLGESSTAVAQAGPTSPELLGTATTSSLTLTTPLAAGKTYYWRVDVVTDTETVPGQIQSFTVSSIASSVATIERATVRGHADLAVPINLISASGTTWSATSSAPWVKFATDTGATPATLRVSLDASALAPGQATAEIKVSTPEGQFTIPVRLQVEPLAITVIRSDPQSALVYAISEVIPTTSGSTTPAIGVPQAYLLEIDSATQTIKRVAAVGTSATDLALHAGDNRIYVTNWRSGSLLALGRTSLVLERTYPFAPFGGIGYGDGDVYRISAGGAGRLLVEEYDQWIDIGIFDTSKGTVLSKAFVREGGGQFAPDGRFYFHGENNSSGAALLKFDTVADKLTQVVSKRANISSYYGSRTVVVSEDGSRVFWSGVMHATADLTELWAMKDLVYATSRDGRYAFSETKIYDTVDQKVVFGMPVATKISAFNTTSNKLIVQQDERLAFYTLATGSVLPTPILAIDTVTASTVKITWVQDALQNGFTLQMRPTGTATWTDVSTAIASTASSYTATNLREETAYEFRLKADGLTSSSAWSLTVTATTLPVPPATPSFNNLVPASPTSATLTWSVSGTYDSVTIERTISASTPTTWAVVTTLAGSDTTYTDSGLTTSTTYIYRLKSTRRGSDSGYSSQRSVTLQPPSAPTITRQPISQTVLAGTRVTFTATTSGNPLPTYQWYRNNVALPGATASTLTLTPSTLDAGAYQVIATNSVSSITSNTVTLTVTPSTSRMINFSVLAQAGGEAPLTVGFTLVGGPKNVLVRGLGPTLAAVGVTGVLPDPQLTLYRHAGAVTVALLNNNDWSSSTNKTSLLSATSRLTGLPFVSDPSRDCALLAQLNIDGGYSAEITGADRTTGLVLVEVYDGDTGTPSRLANISALSTVAPGNTLTAGFVISGTTRKTVLLRAVGPGLRKVSVADAHSDPQLTLFRQSTTPIPVATNNDWSSAPNKAELLLVSTAVAGLGLDDPSKDAVIVVALDPGAYSAQAASADGSSGLVLIEVYDVP
jgi:hypothetical protein